MRTRARSLVLCLLAGALGALALGLSSPPATGAGSGRMSATTRSLVVRALR